MQEAIMITDGAEFDTGFGLLWVAYLKTLVVDMDKLTCAGNLGNLMALTGRTAYFTRSVLTCIPYPFS